MRKLLDILDILFGMKNNKISKTVDTSFKRILDQIQIKLEYDNPEYNVILHTLIVDMK